MITDRTSEEWVEAHVNELAELRNLRADIQHVLSHYPGCRLRAAADWPAESWISLESDHARLDWED